MERVWNGEVLKISFALLQGCTVSSDEKVLYYISANQAWTAIQGEASHTRTAGASKFTVKVCILKKKQLDSKELQ